MPWQKLFESCVSETNPAKLEKLVSETESGMFLHFRDLPDESNFSDELQALTQAASVLLEIKTNKLGWPDPFKVNGDKPNVTLAGTVDKIISAVNGEPEKVQISVQAADDLYREIRIENALQDGDGKPVALKQGTDVDVTIEAPGD